MTTESKRFALTETQINLLSASEINYRSRVAYHEAGHAVAAVALGARVRRAALRGVRGTGFGGRTEFDGAIPAGTWPRINFAGPWAEARWVAGRSRRPGTADIHQVLESSGRCDRKALVAAGGPDTGNAVVPLLDRCWPAVSSLALTLFLDGEITHSEVCRALSLSDDGGPGSVDLANIRAGLRGVSTGAAR